MEDASDAQTGINNDYGTATEVGSKSCGLIFQKEAAGCVEAIGPQVQVTSGDVSVIYQGDVMLGLAMGADYLNPAAAVELYVGASAPSTNSVTSTTDFYLGVFGLPFFNMTIPTTEQTSELAC